MFGMSLTEIVIILALGLVVLGPEKIPEVAKMMGKAIREIRKASNLLRDAMVIEPETPARKSTPVVSPKAEPPRFDQMDAPESDNADPTPERNIKVVRMRERLEPEPEALVEEEIDIRRELFHREVYLHIPYEETI